ncbi:unnamed protein product [Mytilus edulis]|uniref:DZIP3-like HEPN domain-containing protein n=1 Tax=Mytilus edulis TaxID=6550 RepID=A0A8S3UR25_MYTED|nr:unnamed protein product [Mytilus edulis]
MEGKENFIRILAFSAGPALAVIQFYLENEIIRKNKTFETYLNIDKHKHLLFHEYIPTIPCCQCKILSIAAPRRRGCLVQRQFFELFNASVNPIHELRTGNKVNEHCICSMAAKPSVEVSNLDISLLSVIIHNCCYDSNTSKWIQEIRDVRNRFAHSGDATLDKTDFDNTWQKLETATLNFARRFGQVSVRMFKQQIDQIKTYSINENRQQLIDIIQESPELNHSVNGMSEQNRITREMLLTRMDEFRRSTEQKFDGLTLKIDNVTAHITVEVEKFFREYREGSTTNAVRQITVATQVDSSCFDEEAVARALDNAIESDIDRQSRDREKFHVTKVERNCIELELVAFPDVFKSPQQLQNAIKTLVRQLIVAGEIDTNDSSDIYIRFKVKTPLTTAEITTISSVFWYKKLRSYSNRK